MFNNLVATLKADLGAIREDIGGFVETVKEDTNEFIATVKTDATQVLGMVQNAAPGSLFSTLNPNSAVAVSWEEELWDDPDLLCENPTPDDSWLDTFVALKPEEIEMFLSAPEDGIIPELYRELVPARATHDEFFQRLAYHRNRLTLRARELQKAAEQAHQQEEDEEETRWEEDDEEEEGQDGEDNAMVTKLLKRIEELELALKESETKRAELEQQVANSRKKKPIADGMVKSSPTQEEEDKVSNVAVAQEEALPQEHSVSNSNNSTYVEEENQPELKTSSSWVALSEPKSPSPPSSQLEEDSTSVEPTTVEDAVKKVTLDDDEEDDWE